MTYCAVDLCGHCHQPARLHIHPCHVPHPITLSACKLHAGDILLEAHDDGIRVRTWTVEIL